jgi:hypothetical protein
MCKNKQNYGYWSLQVKIILTFFPLAKKNYLNISYLLPVEWKLVLKAICINSIEFLHNNFDKSQIIL